MIKKFILRLVWDPGSSDVLEFSEEFSDVEIYSFEVYGETIDVPLEMQRYLKEDDATLGIC